MSGCSIRQEMSDGSQSVLPTVKMALVKIPLNGKPDDNLFDNLEPAEVFTAETSQVAHRPNW